MNFAMEPIERFRRPNYGTMQIDVTIDDPKVFTKPFTVRVNHRLEPDNELIELSARIGMPPSRGQVKNGIVRGSECEHEVLYARRCRERKISEIAIGLSPPEQEGQWFVTPISAMRLKTAHFWRWRG